MSNESYSWMTSRLSVSSLPICFISFRRDRSSMPEGPLSKLSASQKTLSATYFGEWRLLET